MSKPGQPGKPQKPERHEKRQPFGHADALSSNHYILDKLNEIAMQVYGPSPRS